MRPNDSPEPSGALRHLFSDEVGESYADSYGLDATPSNVIDVVVTEAPGAVREPVGATDADHLFHPSAALPAHAERRGTP